MPVYDTRLCVDEKPVLQGAGFRPQRRRWLLGAASCVAAAAMPGYLAARDAARPRIACTDWAAAESLALLGHMPIAVPELRVYREWLPEPALPDSTVDLGSRAEPNFEALSSLAPDLILISSWQASLVPQFTKIARTEIVTVFDAEHDPFTRIRQLLEQVGKASGASRLAQSCLDEFDGELRHLRTGLAGIQRRSIYMGILHENGAQAFVYGHGSWVDTVIQRLGLHNAWKGKTSFYGSTLTGIATLAGDPEACIIYLDQGPRTRRAEMVLKDSTLWRHLPAVLGGRAASIQSFFPLGGVPSALRCARLLSAAMTKLDQGLH